MKNLTMFVLVVFLLFGLTSLSHADYDTYKTKIKDGLIEMATFPKPLFESVKEEYDTAKFKPFGVFGGVLKGTVYSIKQFATGLYHVLTFNMDEDNVFTNPFKK